MSNTKPMKPGRRVEIYMRQGGLKFTDKQMRRLKHKGNKTLGRIARNETLVPVTGLTREPLTQNLKKVPQENA